MNKTCTVCAIDKPATLEFFHSDKTGKFGLLARCRICRAAARTVDDRKYKRAYRARLSESHPGILLWRKAKTRARRKGLRFEIDPKDIIVPCCCPILGIVLKQTVGTGAVSDATPTLDRIDTSKGYIRGNIQVISWRANRYKSNMPLRELVLLGRWAEKFLATR